MTRRPALALVEGRPAPSLGEALELPALGLGLVLVASLLSRMPSWFHDLGRFQLLYGAAFAFYGLALLRLDRYARVPRCGWIVLGVAFAARVALLAAPPSLSGDVYRYVWEGRVLGHGMNPYVLSPSDPGLASLRDATIWPQINHPELAAIYPPLGLVVYAGLAALSPTVALFKLWGIVCDLGVVAVLMAWCARRGASPVRALVYAWNPLVLVEYAGGGHNDPMAILGLVAALAWLDSRPARSALALAGGALVKLVPLLGLPFLLRETPWRARGIALATLALGLGVYLACARGPASGLVAYSSVWRNNDSAFELLARVFRNPRTARIASLAIVGAAIAWAWVRRWPADEGTRLAIRTALIAGPVAHPWYLGWELAFQPGAISAPWIVLSLTAVLNYGMLRTPGEGRTHHPSLAVRALEYGIPVLVFAIVTLAGRMRRRRLGPA